MQDSFETSKESFINAFSICMTVPLNKSFPSFDFLYCSYSLSRFQCTLMLSNYLQQYFLMLNYLKHANRPSSLPLTFLTHRNYLIWLLNSLFLEPSQVKKLYYLFLMKYNKEKLNILAINILNSFKI